MQKTIREIKEALPNINSEKVEALSDELDKILSLKRLFTSSDGKVLIDVLRKNCAIAIRKSVLAAKNGDKELLMALTLEYSASMELLSTVQDISLEEEIRTQLDEAVREALA